MRYFGHRVELSLFIGTEKEQIINTLGYYKNQRSHDIVIPSESEISEINGLKIQCIFPIYYPQHFFEIDIDDIIFRINANAFGYVYGTAQMYHELRRGDLYKFSPGLINGNLSGPIALYYLPESIMRGLKEHDWDQHKNQVAEWLGFREGALNDMVDNDHLNRQIKLHPTARKKPDYSKN